LFADLQTAYAAGALSLTEAGAAGAAGATGAAGAGGTIVVVLIVPASTVVPQELQPDDTVAGITEPQPQLEAGAAQPQLGAGAGQQLGAGAGQQVGAGAGQQVGAGAGQQVGSGVGQQVGSGAQQALAFFALSLASKPPPWQPASFFACNLAKRPCRPPQSAIATEPKLTANAARASDANRTLFIKIFLPRELNMDPRNATMYFLSYGPNLPETTLALRAAMSSRANLLW